MGVKMRYVAALLCLLALAGCQKPPPAYESKSTPPMQTGLQSQPLPGVSYISVIGDSYTSGSAQGGGGSNGWPRLVADQLNKAGLKNRMQVGAVGASGYVTLGHHNGGVFDLAGINDATGYQWQDPGDVGAALAGRDPDRAVVLLAHQPVDFDDAVAHDVDLLLAGHTHGGQLRPFDVAVRWQQGVVAGLYRRENTKMYVTRGAGFWGPPVRVGAPPDITVVELRREQAPHLR